MTEKVKTFVMDGGVNLDLPAYSLPENVWSGLSNVIFRDGIAQRVPGYTVATTGTDYPLALQHAKWYTGQMRQEQNRLYYLANDVSSGDARLWVWDGTNHVDITPGGGWDLTTECGAVSVGQLNDWIYTYNSSFQPPLYVSMYFPTTAAVLPAWPTGATCLVLRPFHEFLVALNIMEATAGPTYTNYPDQVWWSDAALPDTVPQYWVPAATNQAGNVFLGTGGGAIQDGLALRDRFLIYKRNAVWLMEKTGGNEIFSVRQLFNEFGCVSPNCVASDGNFHYVFTGRDLIQTDGMRWQSLVQGKARSALTALVIGNLAQSQQSSLTYNRVTKELQLQIFTGASTAASLAFDCASGNLGVRTYSPKRMAGFVRDWQSAPVEGEQWAATPSSADIYRLDSGAAAASANVVKYEMNFDTPSQHKVIRWVRPHLKTLAGSPAMTVEAAGSNAAGGTITFGTPASLTNGQADVFAEGRFISLRFATTSASTWALPAFDVCYEVAGGY